MAYKLEHSGDEQRKLLSSTLQKLGNCQPDVYLVSSEGHKVYTQRVLLGLNSKLIDELLTRTPGVESGNLPGISIPATSGCLVNLLKILSTGVAIADNKSHLLETTHAAECIGIKLENCQIGVKKKRKEESIGRDDGPSVSNIKKRKLTVAPKKANNLNDDPYSTLVKQEANLNDEIDASKEVLNETQQKFGLEKKHQCEYCEKPFTTKQAMQRHALIHTDNPNPWGCDHCEKKYDRKYRLDKHVKTAHADIHVNIEVSPEVSSYGAEIDEQGIEIQNDAVKHPKLEESELHSSSVGTDENEFQQDVAGSKPEKEQFEEEQGSSDIPTPDSEMKEKLLADRQKLLEELNSFEGQQGVLDF